MKNFYPSCSVGIIRAEYLLKVKVHFDSALTTSEEVSIPLDFSDVLYNDNNDIPNKNEVEKIEKFKMDNNDESDISKIDNNKDLNNNNNIKNEESAPTPSGQISNNDETDNTKDKDWVFL